MRIVSLFSPPDIPRCLPAAGRRPPGAVRYLRPRLFHPAADRRSALSSAGYHAECCRLTSRQRKRQPERSEQWLFFHHRSTQARSNTSSTYGCVPFSWRIIALAIAIAVSLLVMLIVSVGVTPNSFETPLMYAPVWFSLLGAQRLMIPETFFNPYFT